MKKDFQNSYSYKILYLLLFSFLLTFFIHSEDRLSWKETRGEFSIEVKFSSSLLTLNDALEIKLLLTYPADYRIDINQLRNHLLDYTGLDLAPFTLLKEDVFPLRTTATSLVQEINYSLAPNLTGDYFLSFQAIMFTSNQVKETLKIFSPIFSISIAPSPLESLTMAQVAPIPLSLQPSLSVNQFNRQTFISNKALLSREALENQEVIKSRSFPWQTVIFTIIFLIASIVIYFVEPIKEEKYTTIAADQKRQTALKKFQYLSRDRLIEKGMHELYIAGVDQVLRSYFDSKYQIQAETSTTQEFLEKIASIPSVTPENQRKLTKLFDVADRIKFSHYHPSAEESLNAELAAKQLMGIGSLIKPEEAQRNLDKTNKGKGIHEIQDS